MAGLSRRRILIAGAVLAGGATAAGFGAARAGWFGFGDTDTGPVFTGIVDGVAVGGYDPVAYFTQGKPVEGSRDFTATHRGAEWRFASAANREAFLAEPEKYAPAYGGYCSWAIAQGKLAKGDPQNWDIVEGRLYLNYNDDIQARWKADVPGFIATANGNWPDLAEK
ncbi:YHS domain-containing (seleno)protein [Stappia stellulata]|uniref:YHS domain-containing (seleno)protein n=1 Tax=Stappia stellulata TaxID=71235 RepID=UPI0004191C9B|nr:YHS domain-containing (seleno)protein [Stappia stellulata]